VVVIVRESEDVLALVVDVELFVVLLPELVLVNVSVLEIVR
jgi:hypothetical protein